MLTALSTTVDKVKGFDAGADDYLVKPFDFPELLARIKSLLKRSRTAMQQSQTLRVADLELDLKRKVAIRNGKVIELTAKEFALLEYFMRNCGRVVSRADISEKVWEITYDTGTNIVEVYVNILRKKIDRDFEPTLIHTRIDWIHSRTLNEYTAKLTLQFFLRASVIMQLSPWLSMLLPLITGV
jgi:DNA-binding response OmpR family regulator